ncbi:MAG TPA: redoxin family protein [Gemmatales bacterium]|nr:redoxin family protein [Gemmatales bacterium]
MKTRISLVALVLAVLGLTFAEAAQDGKPIAVGQPCPMFRGLESTKGTMVSLDDFKQDVLVVCITCNHCPAAVAYEDRMIEFNKKHCGPNGKVGFIAINVNNGEADKMPAMQKRAQEKSFNFVYAYDPSQQIARSLGATRTPEFFVFDKERKLVYTGAMDDNMDAGKATTNHVEKACLAVINGTTAPASTRPVGCGIKFDSK